MINAAFVGQYVNVKHIVAHVIRWATNYGAARRVGQYVITNT